MTPEEAYEQIKVAEGLLKQAIKYLESQEEKSYGKPLDKKCCTYGCEHLPLTEEQSDYWISKGWNPC